MMPIVESGDSRRNLRISHADVAQLVEQLIRNQQVTSSSLVVGSNP
jgi:hypothetical protein